MAARRAPKFVAALIWIVAILLIAATLVPIAENDSWWVRIFIFPQAQFTILLIIVALLVPFLLNLRRTPPKLLLGAVVVCIAYQLHYLLPFTPLWPDDARDVESCAADDQLRVLVLNVREGNESADPVLALVRDVRPDMFLAVETDDYWVRALDPLKGSLPHVVSAPRDTAWGLTLYSRLPLASPEIRYVVDDYVPSIKTGVRLRSGDVVNFYGLHPKPPLMHSSARGDTEVARVGREIGASGQPAILAGDLNDVPWGYAAQQMLKVSNMVDPRVGRAFDATYRTDNPFMRWPLDHVYFTPDFGLVAFDPLRDVGADHFPLLADLCFRPEAGTTAAPAE